MSFYKIILGFHHSFMGVVAAILTIFPILSAVLFACFIARQNFQRR
uniref:Uncharacterized protein n=1 Tax=Rhizophora mucronata TaxID=61149 RepID=A0A2P2R4V4_RHIMU